MPISMVSAGKLPRRLSLWVLGLAFLALTVVSPLHGLQVLGIVLQLIFAAFFLRHIMFAVSALRYPANIEERLYEANGYQPSVSVLVACKNEAAVVRQLVRSLQNIRYPPHGLQLVLVDDGSSDRTGKILDHLAAGDPQLHVIHRPPNAGGGKSGALNAALGVSTGEILVVFDADHQPHSDVLLRLVRHFEDPRVGAVQGRCMISNADDSPIARLVAIDYLGGYLVNEYGRQCLFQLPAYGGANCAVRTSTVQALGGWNTESVTEDTDLTLRIVLAGQRVRYDVTAIDEEEAVTTFRRFWTQRYRWARGHQQVCRTYLQSVWRSRQLSVAGKLETTMFLLAFHVPVISAVGFALIVVWLAGLGSPETFGGLYVFSLLLLVGPLLELGAGLLLSGFSRRNVWSLIWFLPLFVVSIALCTKAWVDSWRPGSYAWAKTPRSADPSVA
jgi:cellulose synthase/poly-beta-1,6-N-acetylglucosamine synthase-like glycosyltransferase